MSYKVTSIDGTRLRNKKRKLLATDEEIVSYFCRSLHVNMTPQQTLLVKEDCLNSVNFKKAFLLVNYIRKQKHDNYGYKDNCLEHVDHLYRLGIDLSDEQRELLSLPSKIPYFENERTLLQHNLFERVREVFEISDKHVEYLVTPGQLFMQAALVDKCHVTPNEINHID